MKTDFSVILLFLLAVPGCVSFQARPISPSDSLEQFEARSLADPKLQGFLEENLRHPLAPWPPPSWDMTLLTWAAFYYHPDLDVARAQYAVASGGTAAAAERPNPTFTFSPGLNANPGDVTPWIIGLNLDQALETAGKRRLRTVQAREIAQSAKWNIANVAWQVRSRLRSSLLSLYSARETQRLLNKQRDLQEPNIAVVRRRLALRAVSQLEVSQTRILFDQAVLALRDAERQSVEALIQVSNALGVPARSLEGIRFFFGEFERLPSPDSLPPQNLQRQALCTRADVQGALAEYAAAQAALALEVRKQYSDIHLGPGYTYDQGQNKWSLGLSFPIPILNRNKGPIAQAAARRQEAAARFTAAQAKAIGDLDRALAVYRAALNLYKTSDQLYILEADRQKSLRKILGAGEPARLARLNASLEWNKVQLTRLDARVKAQQALGALEDALEQTLDHSLPPEMPGTDPGREAQ